MEYKDLYPDVYVGPRRSGKTTNLLVIANAKKIPVLVGNHNIKKCLEDQAKRFGLKNVKVITLDDLKHEKEREVIIDEALPLLEQLLRTRIDSVSVTTYNHIELTEISNEQVDIKNIKGYISDSSFVSYLEECIKDAELREKLRFKLDV